MKVRNGLLMAAVAAAFSGNALAAVGADEAKQLGGPVLTEWGAERAGNKDGSIPAWTGEKVQPPAGFDPKIPQYQDPWNDKPLYSITAQNMSKYADRLTEGQKAMFKTYPAYRMDVYQTHRTARFPKYVLENTLKNATSAKVLNDGTRLEGAYAGVPFPIPKNGNEVVWNHVIPFGPLAISGLTQVWMVDASGKMVLQGLEDVHYQFPYWDPSVPGIRAPESKYWVLRFDAMGPTRKVGEKYVIIDPLDPINPGQRAWLYVPGQRRVKLSPDLAYDTPSPVSGGAVTMDEGNTFEGAQDRYTFKLMGKEEKYILPNQQKTYDYKVCPPEKTFGQKNFPNPDCMRFELHRVWHVQMTLKPGVRHILPKRDLYIDEDWTGTATGDSYDASGKLYRVDYSPTSLIYDPKSPDVQYMDAHSAWTFDLQTGIYVNQSYMGFKEGNRAGGYSPSKLMPDTFFSPEALAGEGIR